jgi:hypothetical protein
VPTPTAVAAPAATPAETAAPTPNPTPVPVPIVRVYEPEGEISPPMPRWTPSPATEPGEPQTGSTGSGEGRATVPGDGRATRVVVSSLGIDLPVVPSDLRVRGNPNFYPLCDVAQYLTIYVDPGHIGTTYIYGHAQRGMFLPMLRASRRNNGAEMIGARVEVYTSDLKLHIYEIFRVKRHSTNFNIADNLARGEHRLVLQTSEGTTGHPPKLQVAARPIRVVEATAAQALPVAKPRVCAPRR